MNCQTCSRCAGDRRHLRDGRSYRRMVSLTPCTGVHTLHALLLLLLACPVHALQYGSCGSAGEVYGATGRIGSLLLRSGAGKLAAVPRGLAPGCLSPPGTPILVTAPTDALANVLRATPPQRQPDLVLLCNGAAREIAADVLGEAEQAAIAEAWAPGGELVRSVEEQLEK